MAKIDRWEPYCGYAEYGDGMEGKMSREDWGGWVARRDHERIVKELEGQLTRAYDQGFLNGFEEGKEKYISYGGS